MNDHEIGDVDCEIKLDFKLLVPSTERGETELLLTFIEVGQKRVLKHPLCETFLFLKWRRIRKFFLLSLFFHAIFVLLFTMYVLKVYVKDCNKQQELIQPSRCSSSGIYISIVGNIVIVLNFVMLAKELFQMAHGFSGYIRYWENWLQWTIILGVFLCTVRALNPFYSKHNLTLTLFHRLLAVYHHKISRTFRIGNIMSLLWRSFSFG